MSLLLVLCFLQFSNSDQPAVSDPISSVFKITTLNEKDIPNNIPQLKGKIVASARWSDKNGDNIIMISEFRKGQILEPGYASELYAIQFSINPSGCDTVWKIKDFNYQDAEVEYAQGTLKILDIDKDSIAESSFFYTIASTEKQITKFMMHTKRKKLAIRGFWTIGSESEDPQLDSVVIDKVFNRFHKKFKEYAINEWDRIVNQ